MARTIIEIRDELLAEKAGQPVLDTLTSTSLTSVWRLMIYIVAVAIWSLEKIFDLFRTEIEDTIALLKPHSLRWYAYKAKNFLYGYNLVLESDYYDTSALTDTQIETASIIKHAAVTEQVRGLRVKVAKETSGDLAALDAGELLAFTEYMERIKDAGVKLLITSDVADSLKLNLQVYYNPLVLNANGERLDGTNPTPVQNAVKNYLKNLPFNGVFVTEYLTDVLQKVDGVVIPHVLDANAQYGALPYSSFVVKYTPDAGYLRIYNAADLTIEFIAQSVI